MPPFKLLGGKDSQEASYKNGLGREPQSPMLQIKVTAGNLFRQSLSLSLSSVQEFYF